MQMTLKGFKGPNALPESYMASSDGRIKINGRNYDTFKLNTKVFLFVFVINMCII